MCCLDYVFYITYIYAQTYSQIITNSRATPPNPQTTPEIVGTFEGRGLFSVNIWSRCRWMGNYNYMKKKIYYYMI